MYVCFFVFVLILKERRLRTLKVDVHALVFECAHVCDHCCWLFQINDQSVIISSHKECVKLMRSGGDSLRLKVIRVQHPGTLRVQPKQTTHNGGGGIVEIHPNGTGWSFFSDLEWSCYYNEDSIS